MGSINFLAPARSCACAGLRKAARAVTQLYDAILEPSGLRATQFSVLVALKHAARVPLGRVAAVLVMDRTTLTRNLRPLERRGFVRNERGEDRRERYLSLTRAGQAALERAMPLWQDAQSRMAERIGRQRLAALHGELERMVAAAQGATASAEAAAVSRRTSG